MTPARRDFLLPALLVGVVLHLPALADLDSGLCEAVRTNNAVAAEALLVRGADPDTICRPEVTPLCEALSDEVDTDVVRVLLEGGADPNWRNGGNLTPFMLAAAVPFEQTNAKLLLLLEYGAEINASGNGFSALINAARAAIPDTIEFLLEHGADPEAQPRGGGNRTGFSALHYAADGSLVPFLSTAEKDLATVKLLIESVSTVDRTDALGITPLMLAAGNGRLVVVKLLLDAGADPTLRHKGGDTARGLARQLGQREVARFLKEVMKERKQSSE